MEEAGRGGELAETRQSSHAIKINTRNKTNVMYSPPLIYRYLCLPACFRRFRFHAHDTFPLSRARRALLSCHLLLRQSETRLTVYVNITQPRKRA